jgi:hypothetical protein
MLDRSRWLMLAAIAYAVFGLTYLLRVEYEDQEDW